jgi:REP element-mobilizing transposase RayT
MARKWSNLQPPWRTPLSHRQLQQQVPSLYRACMLQGFLAGLKTLNQDWPSKLIAYVLMPDHFHPISNPRDGRIREFARDLKSRAAKAIVQATSRFSFPETDDGHRSGRKVSKELLYGVVG